VPDSIPARTGVDRSVPDLAAISRDVDGPAVLDGEIVVLGEDGRPSFEALSSRLAGARRHHRVATLVAFDVLEVAGDPVVESPWTARRAILEGLALDGERAVATIVCDDGPALFTATAQMGVEGIVAKRRESPYRCGRRSRSWLKIKHRGAGLFDLIGWWPPARSRPGVVVLAEDGRYARSALVALPGAQSAALHRVIDRYGRPDGSTIVVPVGAQLRVEYTERSVRGYLREAVARELRPRIA
jgi:bifunctional non-homologous end joining protein LigD